MIINDSEFHIIIIIDLSINVVKCTVLLSAEGVNFMFVLINIVILYFY